MRVRKTQTAKKNFTYNTDASVTKEALNDCCKVCNDKKDYDNWSLCEKCKYWYHPQCIGINPKDIDQEEDFLCKDCTKELSRVVCEPRASTSRQGNEPEASTSRSGPRSSTSHLDRTLSEIQNRGPNCVPEILPSDGDTSDTDEEGYAEIMGVFDWRARASEREFLVQSRKLKKKKWLKEDDLDGAVSTLRNFCIKNNLPAPKISYKEGCGAAEPSQANKNNWVLLEDILRAIKTYGKPNSIQPEILDEISNRDGLYLSQIGNHCFVILYLSEHRLALVADGQNTYAVNKAARKLLLVALQGVKHIRSLSFFGQKETDQCGSSAAGIAIEFQRMYQARDIGTEVKVPSSIMERIRKAFHKEPGQKVNTWTPINQREWKVKCPKCEKVFNTKNRNVFNLHHC